MIRHQLTKHDPQPPFWLNLLLALAICLPFWAAFTWLVAGLA